MTANEFAALVDELLGARPRGAACLSRSKSKFLERIGKAMKDSLGSP
jgi:hypothetical protein